MKNAIAAPIADYSEPRIIEVSNACYREVWEQLVEAGYDYLVWPDNGQIPMDGFVLKAVR